MGNEKLVTRSNKRNWSSLKQSHTQKFIVSCIHRVNKWLYFKTEKNLRKLTEAKPTCRRWLNWRPFFARLMQHTGCTHTGQVFKHPEKTDAYNYSRVKRVRRVSKETRKQSRSPTPSNQAGQRVFYKHTPIKRPQAAKSHSHASQHKAADYGTRMARHLKTYWRPANNNCSLRNKLCAGTVEAPATQWFLHNITKQRVWAHTATLAAYAKPLMDHILLARREKKTDTRRSYSRTPLGRALRCIRMAVCSWGAWVGRSKATGGDKAATPAGNDYLEALLQWCDTSPHITGGAHHDDTFLRQEW